MGKDTPYKQTDRHFFENANNTFWTYSEDEWNPINKEGFQLYNENKFDEDETNYR